ncbi:GAF domain-containing protein [Aquimarina sp. AD10]|uniref:Cell surface protein n=1 Tax=Aquimarina aggregata TaxID=1642818 RepID=A0A162CV16_9FLAO|nr:MULTISPECIES: cell surface protein [Aquimarina]AXT59093.1 GAF domain-containing protein [Aquimarina sp. AD10]KZS41479.1 cell surface protein [Aquimarina aggregata]RKM91354.1 GAF domain-containing protein [Aquimarina sp. AD10]
MRALDQDFPLDIWISFSKFFEQYRNYLKSDNELLKDRAIRVLKIAEEYPELEEGIRSEERVQELLPQIKMVLEDSFAQILQSNEIKIATIPFNNNVLQSSERYKNIIKAAGKDFEPEIKNLDEDHYFIMGCSIILKSYYGYSIDFRRPFFYDIPDENGITRHYRIMYNADFIEIIKTDDARDITKEDVAELLDNFDNVEVWKEKFPPNSWIFKGIVLANMFDVTTDVSLSDFKTSLIKYDKTQGDFVDSFQAIFRAIFNLHEIKVGFSNYNPEEEVLEKVPLRNIDSYILFNRYSDRCDTALCGGTNYYLFEKSTYFAISDVKRYQKSTPEEKMYANLIEQNINSAILAPIKSEGKMLGILEIVSPNVHELNSINANKLQDVMPYLVDSVLRSKSKAENELELIIQQECTSIHPSVHWKFRQEAKQFMRSMLEGTPTSFKEVVFDNVYPLYGQIDIKGSSEARNFAIQKDLVLQLKGIAKVLNKVIESDPLPIYEQLNYRTNRYINSITEQLQVDSEQKIVNFIKKEITPLFKHLKKKNSELNILIEQYEDVLDKNIKTVYKHRKAYDDSVMLINKKMAALLDQKQDEAQGMYPHYFERFKTDGVEHNMYIGESITKQNSFNKVYLYNLRLWQLQVMCEMENAYYQMKTDLPVALDVASMVLVFNASLSVRFRMDEKRFDVDGTYNARYEVVKKRVDKSKIKGTDQRITEKGKLVIVYSQSSDEREYIKYINFLQSKNYLEEEIEVVEIENLQGVTGLKALRVNILYHKKEDNKEFYTYEDLMKELN